MNEDIGARGGKNDRRRVIKIHNKKLKKIQDEELEELEKEVKKTQISNILKLIPLTIIGQTLRLIEKPAKKETSKEEVVEKVISNDNTQVEKPRQKEGTIIVFRYPKKVTEKEEKDQVEKKETPEKAEIEKEIITLVEEIKQVEKEEQKQEVKKETSKGIGAPEEQETPIETLTEVISSPKEKRLEEVEDNTLLNIKTKQIVDVYYKELKDIRSDLRHLIFDYNVMVDSSDDLYTSKEATELLESLSLLIDKIEELKRKLKVENLDKYDENYIYTLIERYLQEFKNKKVLKDIKDSELFIDISEKIDEISSKKDKLKKKVEKRKEILQDKEDKYQEIKEKYYSIDRFNDQMYALQQEQEALLKRVKEKVDNAVTVEEKVKTEIEYFDISARRLMRLLALEMLIPGLRGAKRTLTATALYAYYMRKLMNPKVTTKKYKEIKAIDYSDVIEGSIDDLEKLEESLSSATDQIDKIIKKFKEDYKEFMDIIPEYNSFLSKLDRVKSSLKEKESELSNIKSEQKQQLEKNKVNVKKIATIEM